MYAQLKHTIIIKRVDDLSETRNIQVIILIILAGKMDQVDHTAISCTTGELYAEIHMLNTHYQL